MRRVDNVVSVLDNALQRHAASLPVRGVKGQKTPPEAPNDTIPRQPGTTGKASAEELAQTAQGQRMLDSEMYSDQEQRRHGRGPRQGEMVPEIHEPSTATQGDGPVLRYPSRTPLGDAARGAGTIKLIERWKTEMPTEQEMLPRDKYSMFDKKARGYRKGVHKLPKWTRLSQRLNPPGF